MKPIKVLYINGGIMNRGGIESFMMNYFRNINREKVQIDFVVHGFDKGAYDDEIIERGGYIYHVAVKSVNFKSNINALKKIFLSGEYKIVHSHMDAMSTVVLWMAKKCNIQVRIAHSHNTNHLTKSFLGYFINEIARMMLNSYATHRFACSKAAGEWLFGKLEVKKGNVSVIPNAINTEIFSFNTTRRRETRVNLGINKSFVIGHVGRFDNQKNHSFLLRAFSKALNKKRNIKLILVGNGILNESIQNQIRELNIADKVMLLGQRADIPALLDAFDLFVFPSLFEGLGISLIEAQASGLQCLASNTITREVDMGLVEFLSITKGIDVWAEAIIRHVKETSIRKNILSNIINAGYDIRYEAKKLEKAYLQF